MTKKQLDKLISIINLDINNLIKDYKKYNYIDIDKMLDSIDENIGLNKADIICMRLKRQIYCIEEINKDLKALKELLEYLYNADKIDALYVNKDISDSYIEYLERRLMFENIDIKIIRKRAL